ncbi:hypothetical protein I552_1298 [Mycobacterium xenopi 3993]|nr:hypothetical protein I552_1298 [Mycobacterium xenopi 3993]
MNTRRTIDTWVERFNAGDAEGISARRPDCAAAGYWDSAQLNDIHPNVHSG